MSRQPDWDTRLAILDDIEAHPGTRPGMIVSRTGFRRRTVSTHLVKLEQARCIYRDPVVGAGVRCYPVIPKEVAS
jgi:DNA-binding IclR family transcriptional regulator